MTFSRSRRVHTAGCLATHLQSVHTSAACSREATSKYGKTQKSPALNRRVSTPRQWVLWQPLEEGDKSVDQKLKIKKNVMEAPLLLTNNSINTYVQTSYLVQQSVLSSQVCSISAPPRLRHPLPPPSPPRYCGNEGSCSPSGSLQP